LARYVRLLFVQVRASLLLAVQYRLDFAVHGLTALFWTASTFVPLLVVYGRRTAVTGWTYPQSLLVLGFFLVLKSVLEGAVNPSLVAVVDHIRRGTLDFVLLKPADAQFLVSTSKFDPSAAPGVLGGFGVLAWGLALEGRVPTATGTTTALLLLAAAVWVLYSVWIVVVSAAFRLVRVDNLAYLFTSVFDAARWPSTVFRGAFHVLFTWVVPLALMTTWPAQALLGRLDAAHLGAAALLAFAFALLGRRVWLASVGHYTSASS